MIQSQYKHLNIFEKSEELKLHVKEVCREFGRKKASDKKTKLYNLKEVYDLLQHETILTRDKLVDKQTLMSLTDIQNKVEEIEQEYTQGAIFRSRAQWVKGEKNSKYFFALEKQQSGMKVMQKINHQDGSVITEQKKVLAEQAKFFQELYTQEKEVLFAIENRSGIVVRDEDKMAQNKNVSLDEIYEAVTGMKKGKAPGTDGLPVKFYQKFWMDLSDLLFDLYQECKKLCILNKTARQGVISLLPKGNKDPHFLKHWRPLTLLNVDYKILAKVFANRIKKVLTYLVGPQQTGFLQDRQITDNIIKTMDVVAFANNKRKKLLIITIDFEKCFDRIAYNAVFGLLKYFEVGDEFIEWTCLLFTQFEVCTQNAGYCSRYFRKTRSVNQGCPISPYLYLLCGEIMAHQMALNSKIQGITIQDTKLLMAQFADDTVIYINYDLDELNVVLDTLEYVETNTGLKISYDKTTVYRVGSLKNTNAQLYTKKDLHWSDGDIELLGIRIPNGECTAKAYNETINKMLSVCTNWYLRRLTLTGKTMIVNTLMSSLFVYKMMVLPNMSKKQITRINDIVKKFIWIGKRSKVSLSVLQNSIQTGGLKLCNIEYKQIAHKISWVNRLHNRPDMSYIYLWLVPEVRYKIWDMNVKATDVAKLITYDSHWQRLFLE